MTPDANAPLSPADLFLAPNLSEDRACQYLASLGFRDPAAADRNLQLMADDFITRQGLGAVADTLLESLCLSPDPDAALVGFSRYLSTRTPKGSFLGYLRDDPRALQVLAHILGTSPSLSEVLIRNPEYFHWLLHEVDRSAPDMLDYAEEVDRLIANAEGAERQLDALKRLKRREFLRIASRDILGKETLQSATLQLANLADVVTQASLRIVCAHSQAAAGLDKLPGTFAVIGMGKLGGQELNYSSDIDLIYVYDPDEPDDPDSHLFFQKLGRRLTSAISEHSAESYLYRVDLRLRPMGRRGNVAYSIQQSQHYYETWGETFERFALIKARPIAGDSALGHQFLDMVQPFVYRKYLDHAALEEIFHHKARLDRDTRRRGATDRNVKVGRGGIREVELFAQVLQLLYGRNKPELREPNTLAALAKLARAGLIAEPVADDLTQAYVFLRTVEHRLQIVQERQTHSLSEATAEVEILARRLGFETAAGLEAELQTHRNRVHDVYSSLFTRQEGTVDFKSRQFFRILSGELSEREAVQHLSVYQLREPATALNVIRALDEAPSLVHSRSATRNLLANLLGVLMERVARCAQPEKVLNRFERLTVQTAAASSFFHSLLENEQLRDTLISVLDSGELAAQRLIRYPELLDFLLAPAPASEARRAAFVAGLDRMADADRLVRMNQLRRFKFIEEAKALVEWLSGGTLETLQRTLSLLADCCVERAARWYAPDAHPAGAARTPEECSWAILALGKLGGCELTIHSDLDLVFVYRGDPKDADTFAAFQAFVRSIQTFFEEPTAEGAAYRLDTRLRPEGSKGALAIPLPAFERYLRTRAEIWERLAWTRSRFLAGSPEVAAEISAAVAEFVYAPWDTRIPSYVEHIRSRMERELARERGDTRLDFKVGRGGLADIDFLVQVIQIREGRERSEFRLAGTRRMLWRLAVNPFLTELETERLRQAHEFLRRLEVLARLESDSNVSWIETDSELLEPIGRRLGLPKPAGEMLLHRYREVTSEVRATYKKVMQRLQH